jgi:hypothetical protein
MAFESQILLQPVGSNLEGIVRKQQSLSLSKVQARFKLWAI